ncbi:hypothetical protein GCM10009872_22400 [Actinopolymorpha rutila]
MRFIDEGGQRPLADVSIAVVNQGDVDPIAEQRPAPAGAVLARAAGCPQGWLAVAACRFPPGGGGPGKPLPAVGWAGPR